MDILSTHILGNFRYKRSYSSPVLATMGNLNLDLLGLDALQISRPRRLGSQSLFLEGMTEKLCDIPEVPTLGIGTPSLNRGNTDLGLRLPRYSYMLNSYIVTWPLILIGHQVLRGTTKRNTSLTNTEAWRRVNYDLPCWSPIMDGEACDSQFFPESTRSTVTGNTQFTPYAKYILFLFNENRDGRSKSPPFKAGSRPRNQELSPADWKPVNLGRWRYLD